MGRGTQTNSPVVLETGRRATALIVDGEPDATRQMGAYLQAAGFEIELVATGQAAVALLERKTFSFALVDCALEDSDGLTLLQHLKRQSADMEVILVSSSPDADEAVAAIKGGAADYMAKPVDTAKLAVRIEMVTAKDASESQTAIQVAHDDHGGCHYVTRNTEMRQLLQAAERVAGTKATILITGESGTGKEVLARYIHQASGRPDHPVVAVNCAALPETLIESELFGHEKGAFTGASQRRAGKFELVGEGTIILDEIGDMPLALQPKILRILQERRIERLGGAGGKTFEGQVIAITNQDLEAAVQSGTFREDLYYRINVVPFDLPPLRARRDDIPLLVRHFIAKYEHRYQRRFEAVDSTLLAQMGREEWRGNVRELENRIERAVLLSPGPQLTAALLSDGGKVKSSPEDEAVIRAGLSVRGMEKILICKTLEAVDQNRAKASALLGISVRTLRNKLNEYNAEHNETRREALP